MRKVPGFLHLLPHNYSLLSCSSISFVLLKKASERTTGRLFYTVNYVQFYSKESDQSFDGEQKKTVDAVSGRKRNIHQCITATLQQPGSFLL